MRDGLAVYAVGSGEPVLLMPYPHAATVVGDRTLTTLVEGLRALGRKVITFDPPGAGRSSRPMRLGMPEMIEYSEEALAVCELEAGPVDVVGHSPGRFRSAGVRHRAPGARAPPRAGQGRRGWPLVDAR